MERLTDSDMRGNWWLKGLRWSHFHAAHTLTKDERDLIQGALCKLMDYEETGYSPFAVKNAADVIQELRDENHLLRDALAKSATPGKWLPVDGAVQGDVDV